MKNNKYMHAHKDFQGLPVYYVCPECGSTRMRKNTHFAGHTHLNLFICDKCNYNGPAQYYDLIAGCFDPKYFNDGTPWVSSIDMTIICTGRGNKDVEYMTTLLN